MDFTESTSFNLTGAEAGPRHSGSDMSDAPSPAYSLEDHEDSASGAVQRVDDESESGHQADTMALTRVVERAASQNSNEGEVLRNSAVSKAIQEKQKEVSTAIQEVIHTGAYTVRQAEDTVLEIAKETKAAARQIMQDASVAVDAVTKTVNEVAALSREDGAVGNMMKELRTAGGVAYGALFGDINHMPEEKRRHAQNWGLTAIAFAAVVGVAVATSMSRNNN